jgi:hypothetical protein
MNLPQLIPNSTRTARIQSRCYERLAEHRQQRDRHDALTIRIERTLLCGFCALYMASVAFDALRIFQ